MSKKIRAMLVILSVASLLGLVGCNDVSNSTNSSGVSQISANEVSDNSKEEATSKTVVASSDSDVDTEDSENIEGTKKTVIEKLNTKYGDKEFEIYDVHDYESYIEYEVGDKNGLKFVVQDYKDGLGYSDNYLYYLYPDIVKEWVELNTKYWFDSDKNVIYINNLQNNMTTEENFLVDEKYYAKFVDVTYVTWDIYLYSITGVELDNFKKESLEDGAYNIYLVQTESEMERLQRAIDLDDNITINQVKNRSKLYYEKTVFNGDVTEKQY